MRYAAALFLTWLAACPTFDPAGAYRCEVDSDCPALQRCGAAGMCELRSDAGEVEGGDAGEVDGGSEDPVDAGGNDTSKPDAGEPDAGAPDAGDPGPPPRLRIVNATDDGRFDVYAMFPMGPVGLYRGGLGPDAVTAPDTVPAGSASFFLVAEGAPGTQTTLATHSMTFAQGDDAALVITLDPATGTHAFVPVPFTFGAVRARTDSIVNAASSFATLPVDLLGDGVADIPTVPYGSAHVLGGIDRLSGKRIRFPVSTTSEPAFTVYDIDRRALRGLLLVLAGRLTVLPSLPGGLRLIAVPADDPSTVVRLDPRIIVLNELVPETTLVVAVDGAAVSQATTARGGISPRKVVAPGSHTVTLHLDSVESPPLASRHVPLERAQLFFGLAYGSAPVQSVGIVPFVDTTPRPIEGVVYDIANCVPSEPLAALAVVANGTTTTTDLADVLPGFITTGDGTGVAAPTGSLAIGVSLSTLPSPLNFLVEAGAGDRLLLAVVPDATGAALRVIRNPGPSQSISLVAAE